MKKILFSILIMFTYVNAIELGVCKGCHGRFFEKKALGNSIKVNHMTRDQIMKALKGYHDGTYGRSQARVMVNVMISYTDSEIRKMADKITKTYHIDVVRKQGKHKNINNKASNKNRIAKESLGNKKELSETKIGLRHNSLYEEAQNEGGVKTDYSRNAPGSSTRFERAYRDAPPMIPHSVEGLLPILANNNQCIGCHTPSTARGVGATPIPDTHFTNYRPHTIMKRNKVYKEGKILGKELANTSDIKIAKIEQYKKHITMGRFNCTQCHAPQSKTDTLVGNTFMPDFKDDEFKKNSFLIDRMNEGVK